MNSLYTLKKRMMFPLMISAILISSLITDTYAQTTPPEERAALMALYNATNGLNWRNNTNWGVGDPYTNNWYGVYFHNDGTVRQLSLHQNNLQGYIPPEIKDLSSLNAMYVQNNNLTSLPKEIGELTNLVALYLGSNNGIAIPLEFFNLTSLTTLDVSFGAMTSLPPQIGNLTALTYLDLRSNGLTELPPEIGNLNSLSAFNLSGNPLNALPPEIGSLINLGNFNAAYCTLKELPPEIGNLTKLSYVWFSYNELTALPPEIGNLTSLLRLDVSNNQLAGLPNEIGNMVNLEWLTIANNQLTALPPEIGNLTRLEILASQNNMITVLPYEMGNMNSLIKIILRNNQLTELTPGIGNMASISSLDFSNNNLVDLPTEISNLTTLTWLVLPNNQLTYIPPEIGSLTNLIYLNLSDNQLTGNIPKELGNLINLNRLDLLNNNLSGCFHPNLNALCGKAIYLSGGLEQSDFDSFCADGTGECIVTPQSEIDALMAIYHTTDGDNWRTKTNWGVGDPFNNQWYGVTCNSNGNVTQLNFAQNNLNGYIPADIKDLPYLTYFNSHYNRISSLPPEIGSLANLTFLRIAYYGNNPGYVSIPDEIYNLTNLTMLGLEGVGLTEIPPQIANLANLQTLQAYQNQISELPDELFTLTKLSKLHLAWNQLTTLPPEIGNLSEMRHLILNYNQLTTLPPEIGNLTKMYFLTIFQNQVSNLPSEFGNLTALQRFQADFNELTSLPIELFSLPSLWELSLSNNELEGKIPAEMGNLSRLSSLNLSYNNLSGCFSSNLRSLCGKRVLLYGNPGLPDFNAFCADGTGECVPPVAVCTDITVAAGPDCSAEASIDGGSYDVNEEELTFNQEPPVPYSLGATVVTLSVSDGMFTSECVATVTVEDNSGPTPIPLPDVTGECFAEIVDYPTAFDNCTGEAIGTTTDPLYYDQQGTYIVTWHYEDDFGNQSSQEQQVIVDDVTPPIIVTHPDPVMVLNRNNHRYVTVTVADMVASVSDNCTPLTLEDIVIYRVESDEEEDADDGGDGRDGRTSDDIVIADDCQSVDLMDEYFSGSNGRVYTIYMWVADAYGNYTTAEVEVHAPNRDRQAVKGDPMYTVDGKFCSPPPTANTAFLNTPMASNFSPGVVRLEQNYPNPFQASTIIKYEIPESGWVDIKVYDLYGKHLATLVQKPQDAGRYQISYEPLDIGDGIYLLEMIYNGQRFIKKMVRTNL